MSGRYRFARTWAETQILFGYIVMILGILGMLAVALAPPAWIPMPRNPVSPMLWRAGVILVSLIGGLVIGGPLVVGGQMMLVLLDQRALLTKIALRPERRDDRWDDRAVRLLGRRRERVLDRRASP